MISKSFNSSHSFSAQIKISEKEKSSKYTNVSIGTGDTEQALIDKADYLLATYHPSGSKQDRAYLVKQMMVKQAEKIKLMEEEEHQKRVKEK